MLTRALSSHATIAQILVDFSLSSYSPLSDFRVRPRGQTQGHQVGHRTVGSSGHKALVVLADVFSPWLANLCLART